MSQPVKLSDALVLDARQTGAVAERSIAGQIEFSAHLGRAVEPLLSGDRALALRQAGDERPLSELVATVDANEGRRRVAELLDAQPFPHYEPAAGRPGCLVRIEADGKRTVGKVSARRVPGRPWKGSQRQQVRRSPRPQPVMSWAWLDDRPIVVAIAGPNGAGKTTFYHSHIAPAGLRLVNADVLAQT